MVHHKVKREYKEKCRRFKEQKLFEVLLLMTIFFLFLVRFFEKVVHFCNGFLLFLVQLLPIGYSLKPVVNFD